MTGRVERPLIIPVFLPHGGCPHQCVFCNQTAITGVKQNNLTPEKLGFLIDKFLDYKLKLRKPVQISFYGGNFLGLKKDYIKALLGKSKEFVESGKVDSIRFSTRPDTINNRTLDLIKDFPVSTIELGVQSIIDKVLVVSKRGHTARDTEKAAALLKKRNYIIGAQMMVGLPGDDENGALLTAGKIADFAFDFVRIYPALVLSGSLLAVWFKEKRYVQHPLPEL